MNFSGLKYILAFCLVACVGTAYGQCNTELYVNKSMKSLAPGFQFSKSYRVDGRSGSVKKIEYTCVFSKGTNYAIKMSSKEGSAQGIISTLSDSRNNKLVTSYYNNKFLDGWQFKCKSTGIYRLTFTFKSSKAYCGAAILAFKR